MPCIAKLALHLWHVTRSGSISRELSVHYQLRLFCYAGIDTSFDAYGVVSTLQDGHLADAVAGRILKLIPPAYIAQLLIPVCVLDCAMRAVLVQFICGVIRDG